MYRRVTKSFPPAPCRPPPLAPPTVGHTRVIVRSTGARSKGIPPRRKHGALTCLVHPMNVVAHGPPARRSAARPSTARPGESCADTGCGSVFYRWLKGVPYTIIAGSQHRTGRGTTLLVRGPGWPFPAERLRSAGRQLFASNLVAEAPVPPP